MGRRVSGTSGFTQLCGYIALVITGLLYAVKFIFSFFNGSINFGRFEDVLNIISSIALIVAVALLAYDFTVGRSNFVKVLYWVALIAVIVLGVLGWWRGWTLA